MTEAPDYRTAREQGFETTYVPGSSWQEKMRKTFIIGLILAFYFFVLNVLFWLFTAPDTIVETAAYIGAIISTLLLVAVFELRRIRKAVEPSFAVQKRHFEAAIKERY